VEASGATRVVADDLGDDSLEAEAVANCALVFGVITPLGLQMHTPNVQKESHGTSTQREPIRSLRRHEWRRKVEPETSMFGTTIEISGYIIGNMKYIVRVAAHLWRRELYTQNSLEVTPRHLFPVPLGQVGVEAVLERHDDRVCAQKAYFWYPPASIKHRQTSVASVPVGMILIGAQSQGFLTAGGRSPGIQRIKVNLYRTVSAYCDSSH
jgi:hypothetical protein